MPTPAPDPAPTGAPVPGEIRFVTTSPNVPDVAVFDPRHTYFDGDLDEAVALPVDRYPWRTMRGRMIVDSAWMPVGAEGVDWHRLRPLADGEDLDDMPVPGRTPDGTGSTVRIDPTRTHVALYFPGERGNRHRIACADGREAHWVTSFGDDGVGRETDDRVWQTDEEVADWTPMVVVRPVADTPYPADAELTRIGRVFREYGHPWEGAFGPSPAEHLEDVLRGLHTVRKAKEVQDRLIAETEAETDRLASERDAFIGRFVALTSPALRDAVVRRWPDDPDVRDILAFVANWATASAEPPPQPVDGVPFLAAQELETLRGQAQVWIGTVAGLQRAKGALWRELDAARSALKDIDRWLSSGLAPSSDPASPKATRTHPLTEDEIRALPGRVAQRLRGLDEDRHSYRDRLNAVLDAVRDHTGVRPDDSGEVGRVTSSLLKPMAEAVVENFDLSTRAFNAEAAAKVVGEMVSAMADDSRDWGSGARLDAWLSGVLSSWWCDEDHTHDDITCAGPPFDTLGRARGALLAVGERQGWTLADARRVVTRHRAIAAWLSDCGVVPSSRIDPTPAPDDFVRCPAVHTSRTGGVVLPGNRFRCALPSGHPTPEDDEHDFEVYPDAEYDRHLFRLLSLVDDRTFVVEGYRSVFEVLPSLIRHVDRVLYHRGSEVWDPDRSIVLDALCGGTEPLLRRDPSLRSRLLAHSAVVHEGERLVLTDAGRAWLGSYGAGGR